MDLALNNLQKLMCHKTQPTSQPTKLSSFVFLLKKSNYISENMGGAVNV